MLIPERSSTLWVYDMTDTPLVIDHYDDNGLLLRRKFADKGTPSVIKLAADMSNVGTHHEADYALVFDTEWGKDYRLPIVDAGNTLASSIYFAEHGDRLPRHMQKVAAAKLAAALESFGFDPPAGLTKTASIDGFEPGYGFSSSNASEEEALMSLFGFDEDDTYSQLKDEFKGLSPKGKRRLALQVKEAGVLDVSPEEIQKYAGDELGSDVMFNIDMRQKMAPDADVTALKEKVASASVDDAAEALYMFDIENELTGFYGRPLPDPYASVLGNNIGDSIEKTASGALEIDGREYSSDAVSSFAASGKDQLTDAFGSDFAEQFSSDPVAVLGSLPVTHKKAIGRMIDEAANA